MAAPLPEELVSMRGAGFHNLNSQWQYRAVKECFKLLPVAVSQTDPDITIVDYGSSEGHNATIFLRALLQYMPAVSKATIIFNDTPANDYGSLISTFYASPLVASEPGSPRVLPLLAPRNYYDQVLPDALADIGVCLTSLHWVRCMQPIRETPLERSHVAASAKEDLTCFLSMRHREIRREGILIVCFPIDAQLTLDPVIQILKEAISCVAGPKAGSAYQFPVYFRPKKEVHEVLDQLNDKWEVIQEFSTPNEHPASSLFRLGDKKNAAALESCAKAICDFLIAVLGHSIVKTIQAFGKKMENDLGEPDEESFQRILDEVSMAYRRLLLDFDWNTPIGTDFIYLKLRRI
ncbi:S-adenosyl-L-methionine-dependent methyltransferase [Aspergillus transmontanensis]|uniref:S-adenosyl-L-methionine-dependent methyltransferase n=1 Tax=Aspergillus transmontanensis TaxID=1034304 RepID=A0A5N6W352_9EURO|nr:S-adenosyl-L-methionine-dependent methyltransferase [Aspergillus transmontanensis]